MSDGIFLIRDGKLVELMDRPYDSEDLLQALLADYPSLIAGKQIDGSAPRRWLLIVREMTIPSQEGGASRWSLDHLFLDQDGIPTLVEVKRGTDTRIRREVVGQMLDYAANAVLYWPVEEIRGRFEARCQAGKLDPAAELDNFLAGQTDESNFWLMVKTNLQAGKIRMIFVADIIPTELRRIVEFLNIQMDPAEVLALEIKQYVGEGFRSLVPRVIGQTAEAEKRKSAGQITNVRWNQESFFVELQRRNGEAITHVAREIFDWAGFNGKIWFGSGKTSGSFGLMIPTEDSKRYLFAVWTYGSIEIYFQWLKNAPPFDRSKRQQLLTRLNAIPGLNLPDDAIERRPSIKLAALVPPENLRQFLGVLEWAVSEIHASEGNGNQQLSGTRADSR